MSEGYNKAVNKIIKDSKFNKFVCCFPGNVVGLTAPTGLTVKLYKFSNFKLKTLLYINHYTML